MQRIGKVLYRWAVSTDTKGVYRYEYMDSIERLSETKLPPKKAFYSKLISTNINREDDVVAKKVRTDGMHSIAKR